MPSPSTDGEISPKVAAEAAAVPKVVDEEGESKERVPIDEVGTAAAAEEEGAQAEAEADEGLEMEDAAAVDAVEEGATAMAIDDEETAAAADGTAADGTAANGATADAELGEAGETEEGDKEEERVPMKLLGKPSHRVLGAELTVWYEEQGKKMPYVGHVAEYLVDRLMVDFEHDSAAEAIAVVDDDEWTYPLNGSNGRYTMYCALTLVSSPLVASLIART